MSDIYLAHHGVLGQKWGVRRFQNSDGSLKSAGRKRYEKSDIRKNVEKAKLNKKTAAINKSIKNQDYKKSFDRAYNYSGLHPVSQYFGDRKLKSNAYWKDAVNKANTSRAADKKYKDSKQALKDAKKERKAAIKEQYKDIQSKATTKEKLIYNDATRKKQAKFMVDYKDMDYETAAKKSKAVAWRNTALAVATTVAVADIYTGGELHRAAQRGLMNTTNKINPKNVTAGGQKFTKVVKNVYRASSPVIRKALPG